MLPECLNKKPVVWLVQRNFSHECQFGQRADVTVAIDKITSLGQVGLLGNFHCRLILWSRLCVGGKGTENIKIFSLEEEEEVRARDGAVSRASSVLGRD